jgi:superfamily I DNA and/or RNA helicase
MEEQLFDVGIFDEASQLPLQNALGTIQRSKRILVAGDHQQMGPSSYFKSGNGEVVDLLHQASYYWQNVALKHHYRSEHPALIQFSNRHFYNNELVAFPSVKQEKSPIVWHFIEQGRFIDRKNQLEAKEVAQLIEKEINGTNHLGIVAFSETQLHEISACLSPKTLQILEDRIENDTAFFKALENVQGEECDHLIISFAYAYSEENEFHMRFGPMNSKNGSKRLNVLLTRARKKIDFFSSVKSSDFKLSSNESINLLRQFLHQIEHDSHLIQTAFPLGLMPTIKDNQLSFERIQENIQDAEELITLVGVLENRGWGIEFR